MADLKTEPGSFIGENDSGQSSMLQNVEPQDDVSIIKKWNRKTRVPAKKNYQSGIISPILEKPQTGSL